MSHWGFFQTVDYLCVCRALTAQPLVVELVVAALWAGMRTSQIRRQMDPMAALAVTRLYHRDLLHMYMPNNREVLVLSPSKQARMQSDSDKHCRSLIKS